jgi:hypothetical protein
MSKNIGFSKISKIFKLNDEEFLSQVYRMNNFTHRGNKRKFKYRTTNEYIPNLINFINFKSWQTALFVSGSAMQIFEIMSKNNMTGFILAFDYSPKQIAYNYLFKSAIDNLSYKQFKTYFISNNQNIENKRLRKKIISGVPRVYRQYLIKMHAFTKRARMLNRYNGITWINSAQAYNRLKININKIKFFQFEISYLNKKLSTLFTSRIFDVVYISNVFDWLCWHNKEFSDVQTLLSIYKDITEVVKKGGYITITTLSTRYSATPRLLEQLNSEDNKLTKIYKYNWLNSKIYV